MNRDELREQIELTVSNLAMYFKQCDEIPNKDGSKCGVDCHMFRTYIDRLLSLFDQQRNEVLDELLGTNPYPEGIWPPIPKELWAEIHETLKAKYQIPLDRVSGDLMRRMWCIFRDKIAEIKKGV